MSADVVLVEVDDGVGVITMNRPEARNALNAALRTALVRTIGELDADDSVRAIVLTGADPAFCAGVDLKELASGGSGSGADDLPDLVDERGPFRSTTTPVIGAVNGVAVTGGFEVALACDFLIASELARFADTHTRVGIMPGWGLTVNLAAAVGVRRARQMSFTGNYIDATTAFAWGLVNEVVPHEELVPRAVQLGKDIASIAPRGVAHIRDTYRLGVDHPGADAYRIEAERSTEWMRTFDSAEFATRRQGIVDRGRSQVSGS